MHSLTLTVGHFEENCYILWDRSPGPAFVIDPGGQPETILQALRERDLSITHILLTHAHFDHLLAAPALQKATGAPVYVHRLDIEGVKHLRGPFPMPSYTPPSDLRTVEAGDTIEESGLTITFRHTPGHTPGSCCLTGQNAIYSGDTLFAGDVGRVDLPGSSPDDMRRTLAAIAGWTGDYDVFPGHGHATTLSGEQTGNPYLQPPFNL